MDETHKPLPGRVADWLRNLPQYLYPQQLLSALTYRVTRIRHPRVRGWLIRAFVHHFRVDLSEAAIKDPLGFEHFNDFFTRALRPEARPLAGGGRQPCCPVDGFVSQAGIIEGDTVFQAKGRSFSLNKLLGGDPERAEPFLHGSFATLYLSPRDYHRIHMPLKGTLREMVHVPGKLFSVSPLTTRMIPGLFARNERVVTLFDTDLGPMALVLVGAINVSSIDTVWAGTVTPPRTRSVRRWHYPATGPEAITLERGEEMGRFNMGSTVIVLFGPDTVNWDPAIRAGAVLRMGQLLATGK